MCGKSRGRVLRFLTVGIWNTAFGYATFAGLTYVLSQPFPVYGYLAAGALSSVVNITVAYLGYKFFVYKTKGNYLHEWIRFVVVYGGSALLSLFLLPWMVIVIRHVSTLRNGAPYLAAALLTAINAVYAFVSHENFTFKSRP